MRRRSSASTSPILLHDFTEAILLLARLDPSFR
jgi:hypothetical protein